MYTVNEYIPTRIEMKMLKEMKIAHTQYREQRPEFLLLKERTGSNEPSLSFTVTRPLEP